MAHPHKFTVYTIHRDLGNIVGYHSINYGFWSYINRWLSEYGTIDSVCYDTLKANYEFETGIKFPFYY